MNTAPSPETVIERAIRRILGDVHTISIGYIESYNAAKCEASVQPARLAPFRNETGVRVPYKRAAIPHVPVFFPGGGGARDTWPVKRGDACILLHCSGPIARWLVQGGVVDESNDLQRHNLSNTIAIVGIVDFAHVKAAHASARVLEATTLLLGGQDAADPVARKSDVDNLVTQINTLRTALNTHVHATAGTGPPVPPTTGVGGIPVASVTSPACSPVVSSK